MISPVFDQWLSNVKIIRKISFINGFIALMVFYVFTGIMHHTPKHDVDGEIAKMWVIVLSVLHIVVLFVYFLSAAAKGEADSGIFFAVFIGVVTMDSIISATLITLDMSMEFPLLVIIGILFAGIFIVTSAAISATTLSFLQLMKDSAQDDAADANILIKKKDDRRSDGPA